MSARFRRAGDAIAAMQASASRDADTVALLTFEPHLVLPFVVELVTA